MPSKDFNEIWEILERVARRQEEADRRQERIDQEIEKVNKMVGELTDGWGKFVEGLVAPSIPCIFKGLGIHIFSQALRVKRYKDGGGLEIDILCLGKDKDNKEIVIVNEAKSDLSSKDIDEFLKDLNEFKEFFYEYRDMKAIGVIAGMRFGRGVERYAERSGLYILGPSGEVMRLLNRPDFNPRVWD